MTDQRDQPTALQTLIVVQPKNIGIGDYRAIRLSGPNVLLDNYGPEPYLQPGDITSTTLFSSNTPLANMREQLLRSAIARLDQVITHILEQHDRETLELYSPIV